MKPTLQDFIDYLKSKGMLDEFEHCIREQHNPFSTVEDMWDKYPHSKIINYALNWSHTPSEYSWGEYNREWSMYVKIGKIPINTGYQSIW